MNKLKLFTFLLGTTVLINSGCRKSLEGTVTDTDTEFYLSGTNVYLNSEMSATATANSSVTRDWNFGDGTAHGSGATAKHTYTKSGVYTVTLTIGGKSSSHRIRIYPGELSYQVKNSIDRDFKNYQIRIADPSGASIYFRNGYLLTAGSVTDTLYITIGSNRIGSDLLVDGNIQSNKGNTLKFGIGGTFDKGKHNIVEMKLTTLGNFYQTSGNISLPSSAVTIGSAIANY